MDNGEIMREFVSAKDHAKQIEILADLNACTKDEIVELLKADGVERRLLPKAYRQQKAAEPVAEPEPVQTFDCASLPAVPEECKTCRVYGYAGEVCDECYKKLPGAKWDEDKPQLSLVPMEIVTCIARVREYGLAKYQAAEDWRSVDPAKWHEATLRHMVAAWDDPDSVDAESGLPHLWHVACNLAFWLEKRKEAR